MELVIKMLEGQKAIIEDKLHKWSLMEGEEYGQRGLHNIEPKNKEYLNSINKSLILLKTHQNTPNMGKNED